MVRQLRTTTLLAAAWVAATAALAAAPTPAAAGALFGFADSSPVYSYPGAPGPHKLAKLQKRTGAKVARITIRWEFVQPNPPDGSGSAAYRWDRFDPLYRALVTRKIRPLIVLLGAPGWARDRTCGSGGVCPPAVTRDASWRAFVRAVVNRYPKARGVEIWNEPNRISSWQTAKGPEPARYARLYLSALEEVRRIDRRKNVLIGSLGFIPQGRDHDIPIPRFLRGLYEAIGKRRLPHRAGIAVHAFPGPKDFRGMRGRFFDTLEQVREVRNARDPRRKLWVSEFGASTTWTWPDRRPLTRVEQSHALIRSLRYMRRARDIRAAILYTTVDRNPRRLAAGEGYGVVRRGPDFRPKRAYCRLLQEKRILKVKAKRRKARRNGKRVRVNAPIKRTRATKRCLRRVTAK
jgi:hypothetical protein